MIGDATYIPIPLEDYSGEEQERIAKERMDEYIEQNYREGGVRHDAPIDSDSIRGRMDRISYCRDLWNNTIDEKRYDYLYNKLEKTVTDENGIDRIITMELPAKVRHIPIVRPKLQALISKEMARPLITKVVAVDIDAIDKKLEKMKDDVIQKQLQKINQKMAALKMHHQLIATQQQMMQEMAQDPQAQQMIMQMQSEIENIQTVLNKETVLTGDEIKSLKKYYNYSYKTLEEDVCSKALSAYIDEHRIRHMMNDAFEEQMVTGEPIWYVNWEEGEEEPETRIVRPEHVWYQYNESAKFLHQLDWIVEYMPLSIGQVISYFGKDMTGKQLEQVRNMMPKYSQNDFFNTNLTNFPNGVSAGYNTEYDYLYSHEVECYKVYWKEQTEVYALFSENKHDTPFFNDKPPFIKFLSALEAKELMSSESKRKRLKRNGKEIKKAYRVDLWQGVRIGSSRDGVYLKIGKADFQYRLNNKLSDVPLPYIGYANNKYNMAYSPIWETKDIQELYNILHYQEELLIALSGVKGTVYDLSQMPTGMTMQEVMYYKKQGALPIETLNAKGKPKSPSFNQFSNYDDSVSPAISFISQIKMSLNELIGEITGVTRQQTGQIAATDQVGTTQMALQQSNVVTEYYFQKHEELLELVFTRLTNIFPYAYAKGKKGVYVLGKERTEILSIYEDMLKGQFRSMVNSGSKEREIMQQAKQIATMKFQQDKISASQLIEMLNIDTMFEMQEKLKEYEEEMMARMEQMSQMNNEQQKQAQMELKQMDMQMQQQLAQINAQVQGQLLQLQGQIDMQRDQVKMQQAMQELQVKQESDKAKVETEIYKADKEAEVEKEYLQFQYIELQVNDATNRAQMLINRAQKQLEINKSRNKEKVKD